MQCAYILYMYIYTYISHSNGKRGLHLACTKIWFLASFCRACGTRVCNAVVAGLAQLSDVIGLSMQIIHTCGTDCMQQPPWVLQIGEHASEKPGGCRITTDRIATSPKVLKVSWKVPQFATSATIYHLRGRERH